jgi:DNA-binding CsgD family transcriptional regulator
METRGVTLHACRVVETATNTPVNLTGAEQLVLASFLDCNTIAEIAAHLHISPHTVHSHTKNLFAKLKARSRNVALGKALRAGVLRVEPCAGWQEEGEQ